MRTHYIPRVTQGRASVDQRSFYQILQDTAVTILLGTA